MSTRMRHPRQDRRGLGRAVVKYPKITPATKSKPSRASSKRIGIKGDIGRPGRPVVI